MEKHRCDWCLGAEIMKDYHDKEWGVPLHDDKKHFEFFILDAFQAGLSWLTILKKRENFRNAFSQFEIEKIANYTEDDFNRLMMDAGIVRNKLKINATIINAQKFLEVQAKHSSFDNYIWQFTDGKPIINSFETMKQLPAKTAISDKMSKDLLSKGFKFVGSTICYAYMQAAGIVNDHLTSCYRYQEITEAY
jgi:DNA-3-methyladenine glycosylase I